MKTKIIFTLIGVTFAALVNSPACIHCMMLAKQGLSPDDPNGVTYDSPPAPGMMIAPTNLATATNVNILIEPPKTNAPVPLNFTNGAAVGFDVLAGYQIDPAPELLNNTNAAWADAQVNALIPPNIRALNRREVTVDGFMIPAQMENGKVTEFLLSKNPPACCYGGVPQIHEWIKVRLKPPGVAPIDYTLARARGVLTVGAERLDGTLTSIYRMDAEKVEDTDAH